MKFTADPVEMKKASQKLGQIAKDYTDVHQRLVNTASTMGDAYKSSDNLAFVEQIQGFCKELQDMTARLNGVSTTLDLQAKNYEVTRDNNTVAVKKLKN